MVRYGNGLEFPGRGLGGLGTRGKLDVVPVICHRMPSPFLLFPQKRKFSGTEVGNFLMRVQYRTGTALHV